MDSEYTINVSLNAAATRLEHILPPLEVYRQVSNPVPFLSFDSLVIPRILISLSGINEYLAI